jgi:hypothetical protein
LADASACGRSAAPNGCRGPSPLDRAGSVWQPVPDETPPSFSHGARPRKVGGTAGPSLGRGCIPSPDGTVIEPSPRSLAPICGKSSKKKAEWGGSCGAVIGLYPASARSQHKSRPAAARVMNNRDRSKALGTGFAASSRPEDNRSPSLMEEATKSTVRRKGVDLKNRRSGGVLKEEARFHLVLKCGKMESCPHGSAIHLQRTRGCSRRRFRYPVGTDPKTPSR